MKKHSPFRKLLLLLVPLLVELHALEIEDPEVFVGGGLEYISTFTGPATTALGGVGGYVGGLGLDGLFAEVSLSQSILPAWSASSISFNTHLQAALGYVIAVTDAIKFKPKAGFDVEFATIGGKVGYKGRYGLASYLYIEEYDFDIFFDVDRSFSLFTTTTSTRFFVGVSMPLVLE